MAVQLPSLDESELAAIDAWWRANNYLTVGQIYLMANPLLQEPLKAEHVKPRLLGHWGTSPGVRLGAPVAPHQAHRSKDALHHRPRAWWPRDRRGVLPGGHLH